MIAAATASAEEVRLLRTVNAHAEAVTALAWNPDGTILASGSDDENIRLWNADATKKVGALTLDDDNEYLLHVTAISWSPDGKTLAVATSGRPIWLWNVATRTNPAKLIGHNDGVDSVAWNPDGKTLASASYSSDDKTIRLWDAKSRKQTTSFDRFYARDITWNRDGKTLAFGEQNTVTLLEIPRGRHNTLRDRSEEEVYSVAFSPNGKLIASIRADCTIKVWELATRRLRARLAGHSCESVVLQDAVLRRRINALAWSPDGKTLASCSDDQTVRLWDMRDYKNIATLKGHTDSVNTVAFSPDGKLIVSGGADKAIKIWSVPKRQ